MYKIWDQHNSFLNTLIIVLKKWIILIKKIGKFLKLKNGYLLNKMNFIKIVLKLLTAGLKYWWI